MKSLKVMALLGLLAAGSAYANPKHIITGSTSSSLIFAQTYSNSDDYEVTFNATAGYDYVLEKNLMAGAEANLSFFDGGSFVQLAVGPGYNFSNDIANSYYASLKVGFSSLHIDRADTETNAVILAEGGKRFKINESVSYAPSLRISKELGSDSRDPSFSVDILRFALLF